MQRERDHVIALFLPGCGGCGRSLGGRGAGAGSRLLLLVAPEGLRVRADDLVRFARHHHGLGLDVEGVDAAGLWDTLWHPDRLDPFLEALAEGELCG